MSRRGWFAPSLLLLLLQSIGPGWAGETVALEWLPIPRAKSYEVRVLRESQTLKSLEAAGSPVSVDLDPGVYEYQVRSIDRLGRPGDWSPAAEFAVRPKPPEIPVASDAEEAVPMVSSAETRLQWNESAGSQSYLIQILRDGVVLREEEVTGTEYALKLEEQGTYQWRVMGIQKMNARTWRGPASITKSLRFVEAVESVESGRREGQGSLTMGQLPGTYRFHDPEQNVEGDAAVDLLPLRLGVRVPDEDLEWEFLGGMNSYKISGRVRSAFDLAALAGVAFASGRTSFSVGVGPAAQQYVEVLPESSSELTITALGPLVSGGIAHSITTSTHALLRVSLFLPWKLSDGKEGPRELNSRVGLSVTRWLKRTWGIAIEASHERRQVSWNAPSVLGGNETARMSLDAFGALGSVIFRWGVP